MTELFEKILAQRGLDEKFLYPKYEDLFDPFLMKGMREAVDRIVVARDKNERIVIFGDYDADGVTSSTVLREGLVYFGVAEENIVTILPNRFMDGFGLKMSQLDKILSEDAKLVITVDNGSSASETVAALKEHGVDTIVTDHHEIPQIPETAVAVINPHRNDESQGQYMAGVGVAFSLARALNIEKNGGKSDGQEKWLLDLVTIGTICDVMQLKDSNRIMSYWGMTVLSKTRRPGIKELAKTSGSNLAHVNSQTIGFQLGPRINAAGRMDSADLAYELLNAKSRAEAMRLAAELEELNKKRKQLQEDIVKEAKLQIAEQNDVNVVCGKWHEGVVGIAAGHLVEDFKKPAIVFAELEDGTLKGSGRSFGEFSLAEALQECGDLLLSGGGHAGACGLSIKKDDFATFSKRINEYYASLNLKNQERFLEQESDIVLQDLSAISVELFDEICLLEPFGEGNSEPIFEIWATISATKVLKEKHLSLTIVDKDGTTLRLIHFNSPEEWLKIQKGETARVQFTLSCNEWGGRKRVEGRIVSIKLDK